MELTGTEQKYGDHPRGSKMPAMKRIQISGNVILPYQKVSLIIPIDKGELFILPTDTIWGLGVCISYPDAVKKLFKVKGRPTGQPLVLFPADYNKALELINSTPSMIFKKLAKKFWPGALTIITTSERVFPEGLYSDGNRIGMRIPNHPIAREIVEASREKVLAITSANRFRQPDILDADELYNEFKDEVSMMIESDIRMVNVPSTVVDISRDDVKILREGAIPRDEILKTIGS